jgi:hypothetical protein
MDVWKWFKSRGAQRVPHDGKLQLQPAVEEARHESRRAPTSPAPLISESKSEYSLHEHPRGRSLSAETAKQATSSMFATLPVIQENTGGAHWQSLMAKRHAMRETSRVRCPTALMMLMSDNARRLVQPAIVSPAGAKLLQQSGGAAETTSSAAAATPPLAGGTCSSASV